MKLQSIKKDSSWIYCHRGFWAQDTKKKNTIDSIENAKKSGFSVEIDLRSDAKSFYLSHDPIDLSESKKFEINNFLDIRLALNIKSDGLYNLIQKDADIDKFKNSFFFDGSIPEMYQYRLRGLPHALRYSEFETYCAWSTKIIWVDGFYSDWWIDDQENLISDSAKEYVIVSPEIHGRDPRATWDWLAQKNRVGDVSLSICTDLPINLLSYIG